MVLPMLRRLVVSSVAVSAPPDAPPGAQAEVTVHRLTRHRFNALTYHPSSSRRAEAAVVVGDSWADPWDMGFGCWPTFLSQDLAYACVNAARGGSRSDDTLRQLSRAHSFLQRRGHTPRLLIVHTGGNDVLRGLLSPWLVLLCLDVLRLLATRGGLLAPQHGGAREWSFTTRVARAIGRQLHLLLEEAAEQGHSAVLVSSVPVCSAIPLARIVLGLLGAGLLSSAAITSVLASLGDELERELDTRLRHSAAELPLRLFRFGEHRHMVQLTADAREEELGIAWLPTLLASRWRAGTDGGTSPWGRERAAGRPRPVRCWHDSFHPSVEVHVQLAQRARSCLVAPIRPPSADAAARRVARIAADETVRLREEVLWPGRPEMCVLLEDTSPQMIHLGLLAHPKPKPSDGGATVEPPPAPELVGVVSLWLGGAKEGEAQFRKLAVAKAWQGRGIGSRLVEACAAEARTAGMSALVCDARETQAGFYARLGFAERERISKYDLPYVRMHLPLFPEGSLVWRGD
ncbi:hypothetical protein AB1Y20_017649 [Prymnesium parvum]|uniref:N-acetyltransferase domain-containing protein n=1 Tax=Prymnesium parvum TaxID=97485 RepID=A0AB34JMS6_PRYPA